MAAGPVCVEGVSSFLCEKTKAQRGQGAFPETQRGSNRACAQTRSLTTGPALSPRCPHALWKWLDTRHLFIISLSWMLTLVGSPQTRSARRAPSFALEVCRPQGEPGWPPSLPPRGHVVLVPGPPRTRLCLGCHDPSIWGLAVGPAKPPVPCWGEGFRLLGLRVPAGARWCAVWPQARVSSLLSLFFWPTAGKHTRPR